MALFACALLAACGDTSAQPIDSPAVQLPQALEEATANSPDTVTEPVEEPLAFQKRLASVADDYRQWVPLHPFMATSIKDGTPIDERHGIALSIDGLVGVTRDGGDSWTFSLHSHENVRSATGYANGPYLAVGTSGYVSLSNDGSSWQNLPRYTNEDLFKVVGLPHGFVAMSKTGAVVSYNKSGRDGKAAHLPNGAKPTKLTLLNGILVAETSDRAYGSGDGLNWTALEKAPLLPRANTARTSAGTCRLRKQGKRQHAACSVTGTAYGFGEEYFSVASRGTISTTNDGGNSWNVAPLFGERITPKTVLGHLDGPIFAIGENGQLAASRDHGQHFIDQHWSDDPFQLNAGLVDIDTKTNVLRVLLVGEKGQVVVSHDGGQTFQTIKTNARKAFTSIVKRRNKYYAFAGRHTYGSRDGKRWRKERNVRRPKKKRKVGRCKKKGLPRVGEPCKFHKSVTTPRELPNLTALSFVGDLGLAVGESSTLAFTKNGGATWQVSQSLGLAKIRAFGAKNDRVILSDGRRIIVSKDRGKTFTEASFKGKGALSSVHITDTGEAYVASSRGTVLKSSGDWSTWETVETPAPKSTVYTDFFPVGKHLYLAGATGGLWRTSNDGQWSTVNLGWGSRIQAMTGDGDVVLAVTEAKQGKGNLMLRSDDNGEHFYLARELSHSGHVDNLQLSNGELRYRDLVSFDDGGSWMPSGAAYWPKAVQLPNHPGLKMAHVASEHGEDRLYVVGEGEKEWLLIETPVKAGARLTCDEVSGCWQVSDSMIYRPHAHLAK